VFPLIPRHEIREVPQHGPPHRPGRRWRHPRPGPPTPASPPALDILHGAEQASIRRTSGRILCRVVTEFGSDAASDIDPERG